MVSVQQKAKPDPNSTSTTGYSKVSLGLAMLSLSYARGIRGVATEVLGRKAEIRPQAAFPRHTRLDIFTSRLDEA